MTISKPQSLSNVVAVIFGAVLVFVIWQPVFPSGWIIQGMAQQIDPAALSPDKATVLRFELAGKGGGNYNLVMSRDGVEVTEGTTNQIDLVIAMQARDFNELVFKMIRGKADESTFAKLAISNSMTFAGDMGVLELLQPTDMGKQ